PATIEGRNIFLCITEGEAEALASTLLLSRRQQSLSDVDAEDFETGVSRLLGSNAYVYDVGRRFAIQRFQAGGWPAVQDSTRAIPISTEQIIHIEKWQEDQPLDVPPFTEALEVGTRSLLHQDVVGELSIFTTLVSLGASESDAY